MVSWQSSQVKYLKTLPLNIHNAPLRIDKILFLNQIEFMRSVITFYQSYFMRKIALFIIAITLALPMLQAQDIDRSNPPKPGPAPIIKIADPVIYKLSNGITVL